MAALLAPDNPAMAVCRRSSHLKAFYRQLHVAYLDRAFQPSIACLKRGTIASDRIAVCIQLLQAARAQPLIVVCNGQRLLFRVWLPAYGTVHDLSSSHFLSTGDSSIGLYVISRSEEHTSELQSHSDLVCRLLLEKK